MPAGQAVLTFLVLNGLAVFVAAAVAGAGRGDDRAGGWLLRCLSVYLILVHSVVLLAGLVGHLTRGGLAILLLAAAMAAALRLTRAPNHHARSPAAGAGFTAVTLFSPLAAIATGIIWTWPHLFEATRLWIWDDYTYHMVYPALWLREHTIAAANPAHAFTMQAWYPLSASVVAAWFMVPFQGARGDALAWVSLTGVLYAGIVAGGVTELLARLGCRRGAWAVPIVCFATSQRISIMASSFSDADLAQASALFGALVLAVPRGDAEAARAVRSDAWYAGMLTGFALGVKVSAAPLALLVLAMTALRAGAASRPSMTRGQAAARTTLVFAASWVVTGGYWYARNVVHTGNPVYPAQFLVWHGATFPETTLLEYGRHYGLRRSVADALTVYMNWPILHAVLAVVGLVGLAVWLATRRRALPRARRYFACGTLAVAVTMLVLLPAAPYSAGNAMTFRSGFVHWDSMRYVALLPLLGWSALGFLIDAGAGAGRSSTAVAIVITSAAMLVGAGSAALLLALALGAIALARGAAVLARIRFRAAEALPGARAVLIITGIIVAGIVVGWHGAKSSETAAAFIREPLFGAAVDVLDRQPVGTRVAIFGDQWVYPTFGARDHLQPVRLDGDGRVATAPVADAMEPGDVTADPATLRSNLRASATDLVLVVHLPHPGRSPERPAQHAALAASGARLIHLDPVVSIWALRD